MPSGRPEWHRSTGTLPPAPDAIQAVNVRAGHVGQAFDEGRPNRPRWEFREAYQQRLESLLSVNKAVNRMMDALEATGEAQNTLVIFTSDNGHLIGEHHGYGKVVGYEESVRVPLIISGPGFRSGVRRNQLVSLADLTSTIARAAGAVPTLLQDGRPLQDLSRDPVLPASARSCSRPGRYPGQTASGCTPESAPPTAVPC